MALSEYLGKRALAASEYLSQNTFVAPGFHRLFTSGGLALGLWGGRRLMDIVTAERTDGSELTREQTPVLLRPLHGRMRYHHYSDEAADRWKFVIDRFAPVMFGALGAWAGSAYYGYGRGIGGKPFHAPSQATRTAYESGAMSQQVADSMLRIRQADRIRIPASGLYGIGSTAGTQVFGAFTPFSNGGLSAVTFQLLNERRINLFGLRAVNRKLFGNITEGSASLRPAMADAARWMEANLLKSGAPGTWMTEDALRRRARDALQNFTHITPEMEQGVMKGMRNLAESAHAEMKALKAAGKSEAEISSAIYAHVTGNRAAAAGVAPTQHFGLLGAPFDNLLHHHGIPLEKATIGESKGFSFLSRLLGSGAAERKVEQEWASHLKQTYGIEYGASKIGLSRREAATAWAGLGLGTGAVVAAGSYSGHIMGKRSRRTQENPHAHRLTPEIAEAAPTPQEHGFHHWLNGTPLDMAQWAARVTVKPPSMHRLMSATFLSGALLAGVQVANALAGRELKLINSKSMTHSLLPKEATWKILQPLHGKLAYTPGSVATADRWRQALHYLLPAAVGGVGTYAGSALFFKDRFKQLETPKTLEDYADRISAEQSKAFGALTAVTSIFNTGSGLHMVPFVNYSSNMHNRFLMGNGQQVAMPILGKWWSGNAGLTPWGVKRGLAHTINYLAYNPAPRPRELASLVHSVIGKLYPTLAEEALLEKKQLVLDRIYEVRDTYLEGGRIPEAKQDALHGAMAQLLTGEGLENLLQLVGLDPAGANLSANGVSGKLANALGRGGKVAKLEGEYRARFAERAAKPSRATPSDYLHALANPETAGSFAERLTQEPLRAAAGR